MPDISALMWHNTDCSNTGITFRFQPLLAYSCQISICTEGWGLCYGTEFSPSVLRIKPWALQIRDKCSATGHYILSLFYFWFWDRVLLSCPGRPWVCNPLASISWVAGIIDLNYQTEHFFCFIYFVCVRVVYYEFIFCECTWVNTHVEVRSILGISIYHSSC